MNRLKTTLFAAGLVFAGAAQAGNPGLVVPLQVSPEPQLDFGAQLLGTESGPRTVTVSIAQGGSAVIPLVTIDKIRSSNGNFQVFNNNCEILGGTTGQNSCTFDASFTPKQIGELLADLEIDCHISAAPGFTLINCTQTSGTKTISDYFRGIGLAVQAMGVPALSQWGITLAALALVVFGMFRLRRT